MGLPAEKAPTFERASPALRAMLGRLSGLASFDVRPWDFTGRFDSNEARVINGYRVHFDGDLEDGDRWLADVEGEVWVFSMTNAQSVCSSSSSSAHALIALRGYVPLAWTFVL